MDHGESSDNVDGSGFGSGSSSSDTVFYTCTFHLHKYFVTFETLHTKPFVCSVVMYIIMFLITALLLS